MALATAGVASTIGMFAPMTVGHVPTPEPGTRLITETSIGETVAWSPIALPILILLALVIDALWPGRARWVPLLLGSVIFAFACGWAGIHWVSLLVDRDGYIVPGTFFHLRTGPGIYLYGAGGLVSVVVGALIIVAPRRLRALHPAEPAPAGAGC